MTEEGKWLQGEPVNRTVDECGCVWERYEGGGWIKVEFCDGCEITEW